VSPEDWICGAFRIVRRPKTEGAANLAIRTVPVDVGMVGTNKRDHVSNPTQWKLRPVRTGHRWQPELPVFDQPPCRVGQGKAGKPAKIPCSVVRQRSFDRVSNHVQANANGASAERSILDLPKSARLNRPADRVGHRITVEWH